MSVVGIDLGTTNTVIACVRVGRVHVLADENGNRLLPSIVSFHPNGEVLVGQPAKARRSVDARNTIASVKRLLGRPWNSPELLQARQRAAFEMREGPGQGPLVVARGQEYTLAEISAFVLKRAKQIAEQALGEPVERAVITVPAHFNELQRAATKVAGRVAGLEVLRILNEPTAAALAYGLGKVGNERVAVYDFGGGTFDCTLLDLNGNVFEVLATAGDPFLGGDDLDNAIAERMADAFLMQHRFDPRGDPQAFARLKQAAEQLKIDLSTQEQSAIHLREIAFGVGGAHLDLNFGLSRSELDQMLDPLLERTFKVTQDALSLARLTPTSFDRTILVGGSTRVPLVRRRVEAFFGAPPMDRMNPDEVVAIGAAIQAAALSDVARRRSIPPPPSMSFDTPPPDPSVPSVPTRRVSIPSLSDADLTQPKVSTLRGTQPPAPPSSYSDDDPTQLGRRSQLPSSPDRGPTTARGMSPPPPPAQLQPVSSPSPSPSAFPRSPTPASNFPTTARAASPIPPPFPRASIPSEPFRLEAESLDDVDLDDTSDGTRPRSLPDLYSSPSIHDEITKLAPMPTEPRPRATTFPPPPSTRASQMPPAFRQSTPPPVFQAQTPSPIAQTMYQSQPPRAPVFTSTMPPPVLIDVTPRALVVETVGGFCDVIIPRNAKIPCERTRVFSTAQNQQTVVRVRVAQGEEKRFAHNTFLGEVELTGLRIAARGEVTVSVTFELDADGALRVRAIDPITGREAAATLQLVGVVERESQILMMTKRVANAPGFGR